MGRPRLGTGYDAWSSGQRCAHVLRYLFLYPGEQTVRNARPPRRCPVCSDAQRFRRKRAAGCRRRQATVIRMRNQAPRRTGARGVDRERPYDRRHRCIGAVRRQLSLPAADTCPHRRVRVSAAGPSQLDHVSVYRHHRAKFVPVVGTTDRCVGRARRHAGRFGVTADIDAPARQTGGQPGVLPSYRSRQGRLEVRHDHPADGRRRRSTVTDTTLARRRALATNRVGPRRSR